MSINISGISQSKGNPKSGAKPTEIVVKQGETLTQIAKRFNMSYKEFMEWTGLKSSNLSAGQKIQLPHDSVPEGKGLFALVKKYNMTLDQFCKLNGIDKNYKPKKGEIFYVNRNSNIKTNKPEQTNKPSKPNKPNKPNPSSSQVRQSERAEKTTPAQSSQKPKPSNPVTGKGTFVQPSPPPVFFGGPTAQSVTPLSPTQKPLTPVDKDGNVVAEVKKFMPSIRNYFGPLTGKTIMVNAGHGWGTDSNENPKFAPGAGKGDVKEWYRARQYADELIKELTNKGATVIFTCGDAKQACDAKRQYETDMVISLHMNAAESKSASGIHTYYHAGDNDSKALARTVDGHISSDITSKTKVKADNESQHPRIGLLTNVGNLPLPTPSILVECGFMSNPSDAANMASQEYRQRSMESLTKGVIEYFDNNKDRSKFKWEPRAF